MLMHLWAKKVIVLVYFSIITPLVLKKTVNMTLNFVELSLMHSLVI